MPTIVPGEDSLVIYQLADKATSDSHGYIDWETFIQDIRKHETFAEHLSTRCESKSMPEYPTISPLGTEYQHTLYLHYASLILYWIFVYEPFIVEFGYNGIRLFMNGCWR